MAFNIRIPYVVSTHVKKFTSLSSLVNKSKAAALGVVSGILYFNNGTTQVPVAQLSGLAPVSGTATLAVTAALHAGRTIVLNAAAGFVATLPATSGTGNKYRFAVGTLLTSNTYAVAVTGADFMYGGAIVNDIGDSSGALADFYPTVAASSNRFTMTATAGAGKIGDWVEFEDVATNKWVVRGILQGESDPVTPFSNV